MHMRLLLSEIGDNDRDSSCLDQLGYGGYDVQVREAAAV